MRKTIEEAKNLFESITCLRAEGVEFFSQREILDAIAGAANKGYDICKKALQPSVEADAKHGCSLCHPYRRTNPSMKFCGDCGAPLN